MGAWKNKIEIKKFFMDFDGTPTSEQTTAMAQSVIAELKKLQDSIDPEDDLVYELELVIDEFQCIDLSDTAEEAQSAFNYALDELYALGDRGKQIWIG